MPNIHHEINKLVDREIGLIDKEFNYLVKIKYLLRNVKLKEDFESYREDIRKRVKKIGKVENKLKEVESRISQKIKDLYKTLNPLLQRNLTSVFKKFSEQISAYCDNLSTHLDSKNGRLTKIVDSSEFDKSRFTKNIDTVVEILNNFKGVINALRNDVVSVAERIEEETFTVDLDDVFNVSGIGARVPSVLDTDFTRKLQDKKNSEKKRFYNLLLHNPLIILDKISDEMTRPGKGRKSGLVERGLIDYLKILGAKTVGFKPNATEKRLIVPIWQTVSNNANFENPDEWATKGDMHILAYCYRNRPSQHVVLTDNYEDIGKVSEVLNEHHGTKITIMRTTDFF